MVGVSYFSYNFLQMNLSNKRGPPVLPNNVHEKGNGSVTMLEGKAADSIIEGKEERIIR